MSTKTTVVAKPQNDSQAEEILATLKNKNIKLSMLEYSDLVNTLVSKYRMKPLVLKKKTGLSLPHIYNLICLGSMSPRMKAMIISGKIRGTDAIKIMRTAKNERDFVAQANEFSKNKAVRKEERKKAAIEQKAKNPVPKGFDEKSKVKKRILDAFGSSKIPKSKESTINALVDLLVGS